MHVLFNLKRIFFNLAKGNISYSIQLKKTVFNLAKGNILFLPNGIINKNMPKISGQTLTYHLLRHSLTTAAHKN